MADDWEDWEAEDYQPQLPGSTAKPEPEFETAGQALLAKSAEPDMSRFQGEDEAEEEEPEWMKAKAKPKKEEKPVETVDADDIPLDDPVAEKARQQRKVEEADYRATKELFGGGGPDINSFLPKTVGDFDQLANMIYGGFIVQHTTSKHYKHFAKSLIKAVCEKVTSSEVKDLETCLAGLRSEKMKAEKAEQNKKSGKKVLNVGKTGGAAGLDDYIYDEAVDDDYDFM